MPANQNEINPVMSNPAKLLLAYMRCSGITDAKTIAADLDIPLRTIQRLKLECATCANDAISGVSSVDQHNATCAISGVSEAPNAPDMALSRADSINNITTTKDYKSNVVPFVLAPAVENEDDGDDEQTTARGTRLPSQWRLPKSWGEWSQVNLDMGREAILLEADKFKDHWISASGKNATKRNWKAAWRNWCRNSRGMKVSPQRAAYEERKPTEKPSFSDVLKARIARREAAQGAAT